MANLVARGLVVAENDWYLSIVPSLRSMPVSSSGGETVAESTR
jgi:hypothetical protein